MAGKKGAEKLTPRGKTMGGMEKKKAETMRDNERSLRCLRTSECERGQRSGNDNDNDDDENGAKIHH